VAHGEFNPVVSAGPVVRKPRSNVYTVMLVLSLLAILVGCLFLYLEIQYYDGKILELTPLSSLPRTLEQVDGYFRL
jgi:hypothetical protein